MKLVCVVGSAARSHRTRRAIALVAAGAQSSSSDIEACVVDLSESKVSIADGRPTADYPDDTAKVIEQVSAADCIVLSTPIYRGSYTGALKNLLDHLPLEALEGKAVGMLATGATDHHFLAMDLQLRGVLAWFNAYQVPGSVYLTHADTIGDEVSPAAAARLAELGRATVEMARCLPKGVPVPHSLARQSMKK